MTKDRGYDPFDILKFDIVQEFVFRKPLKKFPLPTAGEG